MLSGSTFAIDQRLERRRGQIYLDRTYVHHPSISSVRSILLPRLHLWAMFFEGHCAPHPYRCYIHVARILDEGETVMVEDLYLDVIVNQNGSWQLVDIDEFRDAIASGELSPDQIQAALLGLEHACQLVDRDALKIEAHLHDTF